MTDWLIRADRLFTGTGTACVSRPTLWIRSGKVEAVLTDELPPQAAQARLVDLAGCTLLPGLIDTHVHLVFSALASNDAIIDLLSRESDDELLTRAEANAQAGLRAGITTVRDCGGRNRVIQTLRDRIRQGVCVGPDVLSCGMPITTPLGHCHWLGLTATGLAEATQAAERMLREQADFLKVMATGGNMTCTSNPLQAQFDPETLCRIADIGRAAQKHSAAHVLSQAAMPGAVRARFRTIEHCDWRVEENRYELNYDLLRQIIDQEQYVGLTMSGTTRRAFLPEIAQENSGPIRRLTQRFACEKQMLEAGVAYTLHSDAGVRSTPIERFALGLRAAEIELKLTPHEILLAVTRTPALALHLPDRGQLVAGRRADLLAVAGNPLVDLACLEQVQGVMKAGVWAVEPTTLAPGPV